MSNVTMPAAPAPPAGCPPSARGPGLVIPSRFRGPSRSGNGGYVCGRIAAYAEGPVTVTLRRPPPLATPMAVEPGDEGALRIQHGRTLIAEATSSADPLALEIPGPVSLAEARMAAGRARYFQDPVFPECFVCGISRRPGDGLRIFPGPVPGRALWAAPWTPDSSVASGDGRVRPEVTWAALDCPSGIAAAEDAGLGPDTVIVLGRMTARLGVLPAPGDQCRVIAWPGGRDGRKLTAGSALLGPDSEVLAVARVVWITVPRPVPSPVTGGTS
jgi:hypothetical protein